MNASTLVLVFIGLMLLVLVYAVTVRQRPPIYREAAMRIMAGIEEVQLAIGEALVPVFVRLEEVTDLLQAAMDEFELGEDE